MRVLILGLMLYGALGVSVACAKVFVVFENGLVVGYLTEVNEPRVVEVVKSEVENKSTEPADGCRSGGCYVESQPTYSEPVFTQQDRIEWAVDDMQDQRNRDRYDWNNRQRGQPFYFDN